jgi:hypothetical protein
MTSAHFPAPGQAVRSAAPAARPASWRYDSRGWTRDLRIDFLRGLVFVLLFTSHFNFFSWISLVGWERMDVVSSAEMFILLSGIVAGAVYGKKRRRDGLGACTIKLFSRAWTLYKTAVIAAGPVACLSALRLASAVKPARLMGGIINRFYRG